MTSPLSLRQAEAVARRSLLSVQSYDVHLDLDRGVEAFDSVTTIWFTSGAGATFLDLTPRSVRRIELDGLLLNHDLLDRGRLPLDLTPGPHVLVIDASMSYRHDGEGLHRSVDPADGRHYVYGMSFMDAAPSVFACFDQPDLKASVTLHVRAPRDWIVVANSPGTQTEPGVWEFETSPPLSTYFVTVVAGPYHLIRDEHDGIPLGLSARASIARDLDADADELFTMTRQCFDEFHRLFGIRYQFGDYHQAFVPEFNAGAMENPGCVTFRDPLVFSSRVTRGVRIARATTVAHEMAHQWFGNLTTPVWWDDLWLNESFAEYMGNRVTADVTEFGDAWTSNAYSRRQWGLVADRRPSTHPVAGNGAVDAASALQNFDGISYAKGSAILKQLNARLGDDVFFAGVEQHFRGHWFGNATMHDLFGSWEAVSGQDLSEFTDGWLCTAGVDQLTFDRERGEIRRTPPEAHPADRRHSFRVASASSEGHWTIDSLVAGSTPAMFRATPRTVVVLDPFEDTWAVPHVDAASAESLTASLPTAHDPMLRAGVWNGLLSTFHDAELAPNVLVDVVEAALPTEPSDDAFSFVVREVLGRVVPLTTDPGRARSMIHRAARERLRTAAEGSVLQLAAFQAAVASGTDAALLSAWRDGNELPPGLELDLDLRWLVLCRLAHLGLVTRDVLAEQLAVEPTAVSQVAHVRAVASLPDPEAKAFAWAHFTGEIDAPNYELEAAGQGLWRDGQNELTEGYVARYFAELPGTVDVRAGWTLGEAATWFFPITAVSSDTVSLAEKLLSEPGLDPALARNVLDRTDELSRRLRISRRFGRA